MTSDQVDGIVGRQLRQQRFVYRPGGIDIVAPPDRLVPRRAQAVDRLRIETELRRELEPALLARQRKVERDPAVGRRIPGIDEPIARPHVGAAPGVRTGAGGPQDRLQRREAAKRRHADDVPGAGDPAAVEPGQDGLSGEEARDRRRDVAPRASRPLVRAGDVVRERCRCLAVVSEPTSPPRVEAMRLEDTRQHPCGRDSTLRGRSVVGENDIRFVPPASSIRAPSRSGGARTPMPRRHPSRREPRVLRAVERSLRLRASRRAPIAAASRSASAGARELRGRARAISPSRALLHDTDRREHRVTEARRRR